MLDGYDIDNEVRHHDDAFEKTTADEVWIVQLSKASPSDVVLTGDIRIMKAEAPALALKASGLTCFFLKSGWINIPMHQQAVKLLTLWPDLVSEAQRVREPTLFEVPISGRKVDRIGFTKEHRVRRT
jgi:PIN like domain